MKEGAEKTLTCGLRILEAVLRCLPMRFMLAFSQLVGRYMGILCFRTEARICQAQLAFAFRESCCGGDKKEVVVEGLHRQLAARAFGNAGEFFAELVFLKRLLGEKPGSKPMSRAKGRRRKPEFKYIDSSGEELIYRVLDSDKGLVVLSGHTACFELLAAFHVQCGLDISVIGRRPRYGPLNRLLEELRKGYGVEIIWRKDAGSSRKLLQALKKKRVIAALIDQDTNLKNGFAPFFGLEAANPIAPIEMAVRYQLPIFTSFIYRKERMRYFVVTEEVPYDSEDPEVIAKIIRVHSERLEKILREHPEQWPWWHRRWRRRPGFEYPDDTLRLRTTAEYLDWLLAQSEPNN